MTEFLALIIGVGVFVVVGLAALQWGEDSRPSLCDDRQPWLGSRER